MSFEKRLNSLNSHFFYKEFTFDKTKFRLKSCGELELADSLIWLDTTCIVFQLKERVSNNSKNCEKTKRWFEKKILGTATKQIKDTLSYLEKFKGIEITNNRGHTVAVNLNTSVRIHKVIAYSFGEKQKVFRNNKKFHISKTAGLIHLFEENVYVDILEKLLTFVELSEYLAFRETLIFKVGEEFNEFSEQHILGQFLSGNLSEAPNKKYQVHFDKIKHELEKWDMSGIISIFEERITTHTEVTDYYEIIRELAKLNRSELRMFKERFMLSMENSKTNEIVQPYRFASPRTGCLFVFVPVTKDFRDKKLITLQNFTLLGKYELKYNKCIGVSFSYDSEGWLDVTWCFEKEAWEHNELWDKLISEHNPFRSIKEGRVGRYEFD